MSKDTLQLIGWIVVLYIADLIGGFYERGK